MGGQHRPSSADGIGEGARDKWLDCLTHGVCSTATRARDCQRTFPRQTDSRKLGSAVLLCGCAASGEM